MPRCGLLSSVTSFSVQISTCSSLILLRGRPLSSSVALLPRGRNINRVELDLFLSAIMGLLIVSDGKKPGVCKNVVVYPIFTVLACSGSAIQSPSGLKFSLCCSIRPKASALKSSWSRNFCASVDSTSNLS